MNKIYCEKQKQQSEASKAKQSTVTHKQKSKNKTRHNTERASTSTAVPSPDALTPVGDVTHSPILLCARRLSEQSSTGTMAHYSTVW